MNVESIDHLVVNVTDAERSAQWYQRVLGMRRLDYGQDPDHPRTAMLFGHQRINLRPIAVSKQEWFTADHDAAGSDDLCFLTASTPEEVLAHLDTCGVDVISGPDTRSGALGPIRSIYCRDPDGSLIEIASYES
ncbi:VOC family protein [Agrobacterium vaccinii]|uniref:VOC family protein n=1 Tax=Agrobacterium vaccinii TaxID=2735528 RepID=UPI001E596458|nr:VOC family protein [Agrobacterium vaccinii]UHS59964.1 VOC family protein [Agrobacterium vaccinii]